MKKYLTSFFCLLLAVFFIFSTANPTFALATPNISHTKAACVYNIDSDSVLFEYNPDGIIYPASTVKIMTAILALEYYRDNMSQLITVNSSDINGVLGNNINLKAGEQLTAEQLISALIVGGANDAAQVLAINISGTVESFVLKMNERAKALGAENTYYTNPSGIHSEAMFTTLSDTLIIAKAAYLINEYMEIAGLNRYILPKTNLSSERIIYNRNAFQTSYFTVGYLYSAVNGMNAGATSEAGYCVIASARSDDTGMNYIAIVMGADADENEIYSYKIAKELLDWSFENFEYLTVLSTSKIVHEIPVKLSDTTDHAILTPANDVKLFLPKDTDISSEISYEYSLSQESLTAPVYEGQRVGILTLYYNNRAVATVDLVTKTAIERSRFQELSMQLIAFCTSFWFKAAICAAIVIGIIFVIGKSIYRYKRMRAIAIKTRRERK